MEKVMARALESSLAFANDMEILRIVRIPDALRVYLGNGVGKPGCMVTFDDPLGFRVVDERDLMEYWPVCSTPAGWLFEILGGGWRDQERTRPGSLMLASYPDVREFLVTSMGDCVSVFTCKEPTLAEYWPGPESRYAWD
jgi:hypothetical protein